MSKNQNKKYVNCEGNFKKRDNPRKVRRRLENGNLRFHQGRLRHPNLEEERRKCLAYGQRPFAIILTCSDSRVVPEFIFDTGIGDLFVVRVAGNVADTAAIASIEFAVALLDCQYILVMGHQECGAVRTAMDGDEPASENLKELLGHIEPAVAECNCDHSGNKTTAIKDMKEKLNYEGVNEENSVCLKKVTVQNAHQSAAALLQNSDILREAVIAKELTIDTGYYEFNSGKVTFNKPSGCE
ncbi:MAG: carbonic anhydrase [Bacteroidota bacterium]